MRARLAYVALAVVACGAIGTGALALAYSGAHGTMPTTLPTATPVPTSPPASDAIVAPDPRAVPCSAEDACSVEYRDGAWHIGTEGTGHEDVLMVGPSGEMPWQASNGGWYLWWGDMLLTWDPYLLTWERAESFPGEGTG